TVRAPDRSAVLLSCRSMLTPFANHGSFGFRMPHGKWKGRTEMKNPKQLVCQGLGRSISCGVTRAVALTWMLAAALALWALPGTALAASQPQLPFRCFAQVGVDHVVFGPD